MWWGGALFFAVIGVGRVEFAWIFISLSIYKFVEGLVEVFYGRFQGEADLKSIAIGQSIRGVGCITLFVISFLIFKSVWVSFLIFALWAALVLVTWEWPRSGPVTLSFEFSTMRRLAVEGIPLGMVLMLGSLLQYAPNYVIARNMSLDDVGYFSTIFFLAQAVSIVSSALFEAHVQRLKNARDSHQREEFDQIVGGLRTVGALLGLVVVSVAVVSGKSLLTLLFTPEVAAYQDVLVILAIVVFLRTWLGVYSIVCTVLYLHTQQVAINIVCLLVTVLSCVLLVPENGLVGAAISVLLATVVSRVLFYCLASWGPAWK